MSKHKLTKKEIEIIEDVVQNEGIEYGLTTSTDFKDVKNERFHELRLAYQKAYNDVVTFFEANGVEY